MLTFNKPVDTKFLEKLKDIFKSHENKKDLVDPYTVFSFAGKQVFIEFLKRKLFS